MHEKYAKNEGEQIGCTESRKVKAHEANEEGEEDDMKMFFNYGEGDSLGYTGFLDEKIMEIWLHALEYTIFANTLWTVEPYWVV